MLRPCTGAIVINDRAGEILAQFAFNRPGQVLPPFLIRLVRLWMDQLADFGFAIGVPIQVRTAAIEELENLIRVGATGLNIETDSEVLTHDLWKIRSGIDSFEFTIDIDLLQLVDQLS